MGAGLDFLNLNCYLDENVSLKIMTCLDDPSDIIRAASVSSNWLDFVIDNCLAKNLCLRKFPQLSRVDHVEDCCIARNLQVEAGSGNMERETLKQEHRVYAFLAQGFMSSAEGEDCIAGAIMASSTDHYPLESIENTLEEFDGVAWRPSYWSSEGQRNPAVPETLTYKLVADLCVITEIRIRPFQANFEPGSPIYSAKSVRFRMGHSLRDDYVWTYTSEEFQMDQKDKLQSFKLPEPVLCIGAILQIELWDRVQTLQRNGLFYICVARVQVVGRPLSLFGVEIREDSEKFVLKALGCTHPPLPEETREDDSAQGLDWDVDSAQGLDWDVEGLNQERWFSIGMATGLHRGKDPLSIPISANGGYGDFCGNFWRRVKNCFHPHTCKE